MPRQTAYDAVVVGSGPNGLAAAIVMARVGRSVLVLEAEDSIGGGTRSAQLTLPGYVHDVCSAVHPMALASPFFRSLPLQEHGLEWIYPPLPLAHPRDDGTAVLLERSLDATCEGLGADRRRYRKIVGPVVRNWNAIEGAVLGPLGIPRNPIAMSRFGLHAIQPASRLARNKFQTEGARALFAGLAGHSVVPLEKWGTAAIGLVLAAVGHVYGWPIPKGGSQRIGDALASYLRSLGERFNAALVWSQFVIYLPRARFSAI